MLLALARTQKVDLAKISVLALAQQYLDFISEARRLRLEIAADYLVMAAWLAFLKSKLLLPAEPSEEGEPTGAELAALLAFRLKRLHAMREVSAQLMTRKRLGRDVFGRGDARADPHQRGRASTTPMSTICSRPIRSSASARRCSACSSSRARCGR